MRKCFAYLAVVAVLFSVSAVMAADYRIETVDERPPEGAVSEEIAAVLSSPGLKVMRGANRTVCTIWLRSEWPVKSDFTPSASVLYPFHPGDLIGVISYRRDGNDFRGQKIESGTYTLRYAQQPVDGNHVGTSPTQDFLLLLSPDDDKELARIDDETLFELSAKAIDSTHPCMLCMLRTKTDDRPMPLINEYEERELASLVCNSKATGGDVPAKLAIEIVVVGQAAE